MTRKKALEGAYKKFNIIKDGRNSLLEEIAKLFMFYIRRKKYSGCENAIIMMPLQEK